MSEWDKFVAARKVNTVHFVDGPCPHPELYREDLWTRLRGRPVKIGPPITRWKLTVAQRRRSEAAGCLCETYFPVDPSEFGCTDGAEPAVCRLTLEMD